MSPDENRRSSLREWSEALLVTALVMTFANTWVVQSFFIPSGSMEPTMLVGDHLFVNRFIYGPPPVPATPAREVRRGDIVVFRSPIEPEEILVKRCVGLPGDQIAVRDKVLLRNGAPVVEPQVVHADSEVGGRTTFDEQTLRRDHFGPYVVPAGHLFVMGDNRDLSFDSRFWGPLPRQYVLGRAAWVYWSNGGVTATGDEAAGDRLRKLLQTAAGFFTRTRWTRTLHLPR